MVNDQRNPPYKFKINPHLRRLVKEKITVNMLETRYGVFLLYTALYKALHPLFILHPPPIQISYSTPLHTFISFLYKQTKLPQQPQRPGSRVKNKIEFPLTHGTLVVLALYSIKKLVKFK